MSPVGRDRHRARGHLRVHLAEGAGRRGHGTRDGRVHAADAAARRRPADRRGDLARWGKALALPTVRGLVVGRTLLYPARRRRRGGRRPRSRWLAVSNDEHLRARGTRVPCRRAARRATGRTPSSSRPRPPGWAYSGLRVLELARRRARSSRPATRRCSSCRWPARPSSSATARRSSWPAGDRLRRADRLRLPPAERRRRCAARAAAGSRCPRRARRRRLPVRYGPADGVPVELRGAGACSRQVNNFCTPETFDADKLIACEVLTPGGNWSSYPPHKHDEDRTVDGRASRPSSRRSTTSRSPGHGRRRRLPAGLRHRRSGRSTCWPRCAPATSS